MRERRYWEWLVFVLAMRIKRKGKGAVPVLSITRGEPDANRASGLVNRSPAGPLSCYRHLCRHPLSYSYLFCFCHYYPFLSYSLTASPFPLSCYVSFLLPFSSAFFFTSAFCFSCSAHCIRAWHMIFVAAYESSYTARTMFSIWVTYAVLLQARERNNCYLTICSECLEEERLTSPYLSGCSSFTLMERAVLSCISIVNS